MSNTVQVSKAKLSVSNELALIEGVIDFSSVVGLNLAGEQWLKTQASLGPGTHEQSCFDFGGVTECNSAATALVLQWLRTAKSLNKQIRIVNVPQRLRDLMVLAGLEDVLSSEVGA